LTGRLLELAPGLDKHLASTIRCVDDEIIGWLQRREQRKRGRVGMPDETKSKGRPFRR
jgi:hypothetical protein